MLEEAGTLVTVRGYRPGDEVRLAEVMRRSVEACPDSDPMPAGFFTNPTAFDGGSNIFCALAPGGETMIGYGLIYRVPDPSYLFLDLKALPEPPAPLTPAAVKDALFERLMVRAREIRDSVPPGIRTLLYGCHFTTGQSSLDYLAAKGFERHEPLCVVTFTHDLGDIGPKRPLPLGVEARPWPLETEEDRLRYLLAHNAALPYNLLDQTSFDWLLQVRDTSVFGAFAGEELVGCSLVICEQGVGTIDYLFVAEPWRGKGIASHLVRLSLKHFRDRGMSRAELATSTENTAARHLYRSMGFQVAREAVSLGTWLQR